MDYGARYRKFRMFLTFYRIFQLFRISPSRINNECQGLLEDIIGHSIPRSKKFSYSSFFFNKKNSSLTFAKANLLSLSLPEIKHVEGGRISLEAIDAIQGTQHQANISESPASYTSVITNTRNQQYS